LKHGYIKELAQQLEMSQAGLGRALNDSRLEERKDDPSYLFSAKLARRLEEFFALKPLSLEGNEWAVQKAFIYQFETLVTQELSQHYITNDESLVLNRDYNTRDRIDGMRLYADISITLKNGDVKLLCECKSYLKFHRRPKHLDMAKLAAVAYVSDSKYIVLATPKPNTSELEADYVIYELRPGRMVQLLQLPTRKDLLG